MAVAAGPARAEPDTKDANDAAATAFSDAKAAFARSEFERAARRFEDAARLSPHPAALLNAADAWERAGERARAARLCDEVLATPSLRAPYREAAEEQLARLAPKIALLEIAGSPSARVSIDGGPDRALPDRVRLEPGEHTIVVGRPPPLGATSDRITLAPGESRRLEIPAGETRPARRPWPPPAPALVAFGGAAAFGAAGVFFGVRTIDAQAGYERAPTVDGRDDFYRERLVTNVALSLAGAALVTGVVLWLATPRAAER